MHFFTFKNCVETWTENFFLKSFWNLLVFFGEFDLFQVQIQHRYSND